jgi:nitrite reductase/ring-hydroxylating ferredoxin subunit
MEEEIFLFKTMEEALDQLKPNTIYDLTIKGVQLCLIRFDSQLYVTEKSCPHSGGIMSSGKVNYLGELVCPMHAYRFNLKNGREAENRCKNLKTHPVYSTKEGVFVHIVH